MKPSGMIVMALLGGAAVALLDGNVGLAILLWAALTTAVLTKGLAVLFHPPQGGARPPRPGVCRRCGYSLTGNVSGVCPECGAKFAAPPTERTRSESV